MNVAVLLTRLSRIEPHEAVEQLPLFLQRAVQGRRGRGRRVIRRPHFALLCFARLPVTALPRLPLHQQIVHVFGFE